MYQDEIFIHACNRNSGESTICVLNKDKSIRTLSPSNCELDDWRFHRWVLCLKDEFLYTIATRSHQSVIVKLNLQGDLVHQFNVNIDGGFISMLQVSSTYIVLVNLSILSVYSMEGCKIGSWKVDINLHCMTNLAIHENYIYLIESSSASAIHRFCLRNERAGATLIHQKIVPHPETIMRPRGLCVTSRFIYVVSEQMSLVLLDQEGQHLVSYSQPGEVTPPQGGQTNNLVLDGDLLYVYEEDVTEMHLWKLNKR